MASSYWVGADEIEDMEAELRGDPYANHVMIEGLSLPRRKRPLSTVVEPAGLKQIELGTPPQFLVKASKSCSNDTRWKIHLAAMGTIAPNEYAERINTAFIYLMGTALSAWARNTTPINT